MNETKIVLTVQHKKPLPPDATDVIANRFYSWSYAQGVEVGVKAEIVDSCRKCGGFMKPGKAMGQTFAISNEGTCSPAGPGVLVDCMKCAECGWSVEAI